MLDRKPLSGLVAVTGVSRKGIYMAFIVLCLILAIKPRQTDVGVSSDPWWGNAEYEQREPIDTRQGVTYETSAFF